MRKISLCMPHLRDQVLVSSFSEGTMIQIVPTQDACCINCRVEGMVIFE